MVSTRRGTVGWGEAHRSSLDADELTLAPPSNPSRVAREKGSLYLIATVVKGSVVGAITVAGEYLEEG